MAECLNFLMAMWSGFELGAEGTISGLYYKAISLCCTKRLNNRKIVVSLQYLL